MQWHSDDIWRCHKCNDMLPISHLTTETLTCLGTTLAFFSYHKWSLNERGFTLMLEYPWMTFHQQKLDSSFISIEHLVHLHFALHWVLKLFQCISSCKRHQLIYHDYHSTVNSIHCVCTKQALSAIRNNQRCFNTIIENVFCTCIFAISKILSLGTSAV